MLELVGNPEDRFSHKEAHMQTGKTDQAVGGDVQVNLIFTGLNIQIDGFVTQQFIYFACELGYPVLFCR